MPVKGSDPAHAASCTRTVRLKVRAESCGWLNAAAAEMNQVFNWANETSLKAATRTDLKRKWMSGFDLCSLSAGATEYFERIGADTIAIVANDQGNGPWPERRAVGIPDRRVRQPRQVGDRPAQHQR